MQPRSLPASTATTFAPRVRWPRPLTMATVRELLLLGLLLGCCAPFVPSLVTGNGALPLLGPIRAHRVRGEVAGFVVLSFVLAQLALAGMRFARKGVHGLGKWPSVHRLTAVPLIAAII